MIGDRAIVVGGGFAGLFAARLLDEQFDSIVVVDRDELGGEPEPRTGVPQDFHPNVPDPRGTEGLKECFPEVYADLTDREGVAPINPYQDILVVRPPGMILPTEDENRQLDSVNREMVVARRPLIETAVQTAVREMDSVTILERHDVDGYVVDEDGNIAGVRVHDRANENREEIRGDFVVEASGRHSDVFDRLESCGFEPPRVEMVRNGVGNSTVWLDIPGGLRNSWGIALDIPEESETRGYLAFDAEQDIYGVVLVGWNEDYPPTNYEELLEWSTTVSSPIARDLLEIGDPISSVRGWRKSRNRRRHYEELPEPPGHFAVVGDAFMSLNPVFGQGIGNAYTQVRELADFLGERSQVPGSDDVRDLYGRLADAMEDRWGLAALDDLRFPESEIDGAWLPAPVRSFMQAYFALFEQAATADPVCAKTWREVIWYHQPIEQIATPSVLGRVMTQVASRLGGDVPSSEIEQHRPVPHES